MKIKKSELLALIKEEIMSEMDGLTMMDDPSDDDAVPAEMEQGGAMDQVAEQMEGTIISSMDEAISMVSNHLVTTEGNRDTRQLMMRGMDMLHDAGFREPSADALERMISGDDEDDMGMMQEGIENINAENMQIVADALQKMAPLLGVMSLPVLIGLIYEQLKSMGAK
jgi:hypothetical protein